MWVDGAEAAATNMARDHGLAASLPPGRGVVRFYRWRRPTVSLGRNETSRGRWDSARLAEEGVELVRRPTGGRTVLHDRELTYAVVAPAAGPGSMRRLYHAVNRALVAGLVSLGIPARSAPRVQRTPGPDAGPCFAAPAEGEVVVAGLKLVGSAQVRLDGRLLQHGSILIGDDQRRLTALQSAGSVAAPTDLSGGVTSLDAWLQPVPTTRDLVSALVPAFERVFGGHWHPDAPPVTLDEGLEARLEAHYRSAAWTLRR